jgi:hypothetical protein
MLKAFPLLAIVVILYNVFAFMAGPGLADPVAAVELPSGAVWTFTVGELMICGGLVLLFFEIFKATVVSGASSLDHALSMALFVVCLLEFLLVKACGTSVFMIIALLTFIDVIAAFSISVATARRDISVSDRL